MTIDEQSSAAVIAKLMLFWPKSDNDDLSFFQRFFDDIDVGFQGYNLSNRPHGTFSLISRPLIVGNIARFIVYDSSEPNYPNMATLVKGSDHRWRLQSFLFQCLSCFGAGVIINAPCSTCGSSGWGFMTE